MGADESELVEVEDDEAEVYVSDPEDYVRNRKLKLINRAKERVHEIRESRLEYTEHKDFRDAEWYDIYHKELAQAVAHYGNELLPLAEQAIKKGDLSESVLEAESCHPAHGKSSWDITAFIVSNGRISKDGSIEVPSPIITMEFYRQLQQIERELGLGVEIEEDKGPAQI